MIVRHKLHPARVWPYVWKEMTLSIVLAVFVGTVGDAHPGLPDVSLPFAPLGVLGTALAILLAFRSNTGYARWWQARTHWAGIMSNCRTLARIVMASTEYALRNEDWAARVLAYRREMIYRQIAFAHALRLHLRGERDWSVLEPLLPAEEYGRLRSASNKPNLILQALSTRFRDGYRAEFFGKLDPVAIELQTSALNQAQSACESIKNTPMLSQYDFFTRVFLWLFLALLPSSLHGLFPSGGGRWYVIPVSIAIAFVFTTTAKVGQVNDDPFENRVHDVPMTSLCNTIERDLREQLGETKLPPVVEPRDGYLY